MSDFLIVAVIVFCSHAIAFLIGLRLGGKVKWVE